MRFHQYLDPTRISLSIEASRKKEAIKEVARLLHDAPEVEDFERFLKDVFERETVESTGIGNGVAVPHARTDAVESLIVSVGRSEQGVEFGAVDGKPVRILFCMGTPRQGVTEYLRLLAHVTRLVHQEGFVNRLLAASSPEELISVFREAEE